MNPKETLEYDLRLKNPTRGLETDYGGSRSSAIDLFCLACMGASIGSVSYCKSYTCSLWRFRPGSGKTDRPDGTVPTKEEYEKLIESKKTPEKIEAGKKLSKSNKK